VQRSFYLPDEVVEALRTASFELRESQSEIVERAIRKELGLVKLAWQVIEDNGGGLHLGVFEGKDVIYYNTGYEHNEGGLKKDVTALENGDDPRDGWEIPTWIVVEGRDFQSLYDELTSHEHGWRVVADQDGVYHDRMGAAAKRVFGEEYEGWTIRTGFLAGNLFNDSGDYGGTYDMDASAARYAEMCREALEREFPGAEVSVDYQLNAQGATPIPLQTRVIDPDGGDYQPGDYGDGGRIAEHVEEICGRVWESWEWVVYEER